MINKIREEIHTETQRHRKAFKQQLRVSVPLCELRRIDHCLNILI